MQMSLYNHVLIKPQEYGFVGLANYARLLHDETFWLSLWNSFLWVFGSVSFQFLGGFAAALLLHQSFRGRALVRTIDRKSTRLNSSHITISYAVFCLTKKRQ